jgi:putative FmdB family regulatory protein
MPMYEFRCGSCGYGVERYVAGKSGSQAAEKCPKCGKANLEKVFSTFASNCCGSSGGGTLPQAGGCGGGSSHFS